MDLVSMFSPEREIFRLKKNGITYTISRKGKKKIFRLNGNTYSTLNDDSVYVGSYWDFFMPLPAIYGSTEILVIGLGIGTIPFQLSSIYGSKVVINVVEVDSELVDLTKKFLPYGKMDFKVFVEDGIEFVRKQKDEYDLIIQDAFIDLSVPIGFMQDNFISAAARALTFDGILAINYISREGYPSEYVQRLSLHFRHVYVMAVNPLLSGNYIIICSKQLDKNQMLKSIREKMQITDENKHLLKAYSSMQ